jgi:NO-binding membrane sensor protein with MHYT domain
MSSAASTVETSFLLWALGAFIALLTAHVAMGSVRNSQYLHGFRRWSLLVLAALVFASGICVASSLGLTGESFPFPLGYQRLVVLGLWLGAAAACLLIFAWPSLWPGLVASVGAGILLGLVVGAVHVGFVTAVGFRPGVRWRNELLGLGGLILVFGFAAAVAMIVPGLDSRNRRRWWRFAGAGAMALTSMAGQAMVIAAAGLQTQVGSIYRNELPASMLSLVGGGIVPLVLLILAVDLELRRRILRRSHRREQRAELRRRRAEAAAAASEPGLPPPAEPQT